jgi:hypothetical protein
MKLLNFLMIIIEFFYDLHLIQLPIQKKLHWKSYSGLNFLKLLWKWKKKKKKKLDPNFKTQCKLIK